MSDAPTSDRVVLIDRSASFRPGASTEDRGRRLVELAASLAVADFGAPDIRTVSIGLYGGEDRVWWIASGLALPAATGAEVDVLRGQEQAAQCVAELLAPDLAAPPATTGSSLASALYEAADKVARAAGQRRIVAIGDGLDNIGCVQLGSADLKRGRPNKQLFNDCDRVLTHRDLTGIDVDLVELGNSTNSTVDSAQRQWLEAFWQEFVGFLGGTPDTAPKYKALPPPAPETGVDGPADPPVAVPAKRPRRPRTSDKLTVPSDVLFDTDEHTFQPGGRERLVGFLSDALDKDYIQFTDPTLKVTVIGHTDERDSTGYNQRLSERRADTVRDALRAAGVSKVTAEGRGETRPLCGAHNEGCWRKNRRVEIRVSYQTYGPE